MELLILVIAIAIYFAPAITAHQRGKANVQAIFWLNFLTGWTFVGWVIALVWALTVERPAVRQY